MATRSNPTWIITQQPREVPFRKGPFYDDKYVEDFLREAYRIYPDIICIVVDGPMDRDWQPQHGYEWLDMNGDRRKRHPRKNRMATSPQPNVAAVKALEWMPYRSDGATVYEGQNQKRRFVASARFPWGGTVCVMEKDGWFTLDGSCFGAFIDEQGAKDAAQVEYERWIRAALATTEGKDNG